MEERDELEYELKYDPWKEHATPTPTTSPSSTAPSASAVPKTQTAKPGPQKSSRLSSEDVLSHWDTILKRTGKPECPTGLECLDSVIWGLHREEILVIGGRPGQGKSAFATQLAIAASEQNRVLYYSLEMSRVQTIERLISHFARLDNQILRRGTAELAKSTRRIKEIAVEISALDFHLLDDRGYKPTDYGEDVKEIKPDYVFLDYIQLTRRTEENQYEKTHEAIGRVLAYLKRLSKVHRCGFVVCSQLNRQLELKASGSLEEVADTVIELSWKGQANPDLGARGEYIANVVKQRHGAIDKVKLWFIPEQYKFVEK